MADADTSTTPGLDRIGWEIVDRGGDVIQRLAVLSRSEIEQLTHRGYTVRPIVVSRLIWRWLLSDEEEADFPLDPVVGAELACAGCGMSAAPDRLDRAMPLGGDSPVYCCPVCGADMGPAPS